MSRKHPFPAEPAIRCVCLAIVGTMVGVHADDWPTYRHDIARSGVTAEKLKLPLSVEWTIEAGALEVLNAADDASATDCLRTALEGSTSSVNGRCAATLSAVSP